MHIPQFYHIRHTDVRFPMEAYNSSLLVGSDLMLRRVVTEDRQIVHWRQLSRVRGQLLARQQAQNGVLGQH